MSATSSRSMLEDLLGQLLAAHCSADYVRKATTDGATELWHRFQELDLTLASLPEENGGGGGEPLDDVTILLAAGRHAAPLPLVETGFVGANLLAASGLSIPSGPLALVLPDMGELQISEDHGQYRVRGAARDVAFASEAAAFVTVAETIAGVPVVLTVGSDAVSVAAARNIAGEARDRVIFNDVRATQGAVIDRQKGLRAASNRAAFGRALMMVGAMQTTLKIVVEYAKQRRQFGRSISSFQAVQTLLALIAEDVALAEAVVAPGIASLELRRDLTLLNTASAKVVCADTATRIAEHAHQIMGAIGITIEHPLHLYTNRLLAWRDDFGSESAWSVELGRLAIEHDAGVWDLLTEGPPNRPDQRLASV